MAAFLIWTVYLSTGFLWLLFTLIVSAASPNAATGMFVGLLVVYVPGFFLIRQVTSSGDEEESEAETSTKS